MEGLIDAKLTLQKLTPGTRPSTSCRHLHRCVQNQKCFLLGHVANLQVHPMQRHLGISTRHAPHLMHNLHHPSVSSAPVKDTLVMHLRSTQMHEDSNHACLFANRASAMYPNLDR
jgi:hypothetical protein